MDKSGVGEIKVAGIFREHLQITCKLVIVFYDCLTNLVSNNILTIADCHRLKNKVAGKKSFYAINLLMIISRNVSEICKWSPSTERKCNFP